MQSRGLNNGGHPSISARRPATMSHGDYGQRWGEGAARCLMIDGDFDEDEGVRLMPIPDCFICPMTATVMEDPVMTVDGCVYERTYIERWMRQRQQEHLRVTSPATNKELPSLRLVSLTALRKAIEAYLVHRPEIRDAQSASRSFEEAAQMLYGDLLEKQAVHSSAEDELSLLKDSNEVLLRAVQDAEHSSAGLRCELEQARAQAQAFGEALKKEKAANAALRARLQELEGTSPRAESEGLGSRQRKNLAEDTTHAEHGMPTEGMGTSSSSSSPKVSSKRSLNGHKLTNSTSAEKCDTCTAASSSNKKEFSSRTAARTIAARQECEAKEDGDTVTRRLYYRDLWAVIIFFFVLLLIILFRDFGMESMVHTSPVCNISANKTVMPATEKLSLDRAEPAAFPIERRDQHQDEPQKKIFLNQIGRLSSGSIEEKTHAALVLGIAAATSPENQDAIAHAGAIEPLVELLDSDATEARGQATVALRTLALDNTANKITIARAGAIPRLLALLRDSNIEVQEVAAAALQVFTDAQGQQELAEMAEADVIDSFNALFEHEMPRELLLDLSKHQSHQPDRPDQASSGSLNAFAAFHR